ncbi:hypothetical protein BROUX41_000721 [Berkeleyomyces rouxiae]|uniref:uncharacterized protein n=1 Tax=Berkeleyomyces rouxiae TaxID=2035830 RepID=UPI003B80DE77
MTSPGLAMAIGLIALSLCMVGLGFAAKSIVKKMLRRCAKEATFDGAVADSVPRGASDEENQLDSVRGAANNSVEKTTSKISRADTVVDGNATMKSE